MPKKMTTSDMEAENEFRLGQLVGKADRDLAVTSEVLGGILWKLEEINVAIREGAFRGDPPVGSEPYVRRLRDQAAVANWAGFRASPDEGDQYAQDDAVKEANTLVRALGYQPPGEPRKEG